MGGFTSHFLVEVVQLRQYMPVPPHPTMSCPFLAAGHSLTSIQRTMGHETITTTSDTYGHLFRADRDAFANLVPSAPRELGSGA